MAYFTQEQKREIAPEFKAIMRKYSLKGSLSVDNYSSVVATIFSGKIDFIGQSNEAEKAYCKRTDRPYYADRDNLQVNHYHLESSFQGQALDALNEIKALLFRGNYDNSNVMADYFDVGWYVSINIGRWNKPYKLS